jgi:ribose 5-phosphate isomerase B
MKIAIGSDHAGYQMKELLKSAIREFGHEVKDFGTFSENSCDYPDFGRKVALSVKAGDHDYGVLICGTGIGMCMVANKVPGIRAALCCNIYMAEMSRRHNDANILVLGGRVIGTDLAREMLRTFLATRFEGDRHKRRVEKIMSMD